MTEEHWEKDKHKFEDDFEGRREYGDEERRGYGGGGYGGRGGDTIVENQTFIDDDYRPRNDTFVENETIVNEDSYDNRRGSDTIIQNETIVDDDGYGGRNEYNETTVMRDDGYDNGYRGDAIRDDGFVDDAARWTGDKVCSHLCTPRTKRQLMVVV